MAEVGASSVVVVGEIAIDLKFNASRPGQPRVRRFSNDSAPVFRVSAFVECVRVVCNLL